MPYLQRAPRAELRGFVHGLWVQEAAADRGESEPTHLLPAPGVELVVCFGDAFEQLEGAVVRRRPAFQLAGQRTRSIRVRATGRTGMVIARCHPWAAGRLLGAPAELVDGVLDPGDAELLVEQVALARSPAARLRLVERYLHEIFADHTPDPLVVAAMARLNARWGALSVAALADELSISRRQLQRRFLRAVGVGPKRCARLIRFQKAVGRLRAGAHWEQVAERCGYVDQAHVIGELRELSGMSPGVLQRRATTPLMRYYNSRHLEGLYNTVYL